MKRIDIGQIRARRARLVQEIAQRRQGIAALQEELVSLESRLADLDVAERVFTELESEGADAEDVPTPRVDASEPELLETATESEEAHSGADEKDSPVSETEARPGTRGRRISPKIAAAADLWVRPSEEISAARIGKVVGLSTRTLYNRLGPRDVARRSADPDETDVAKTNQLPPAQGADRPPKPEGIPLVPEMIIEAFNHALSEGKAGLKVSELIAFVRDRYWPEAPANSIGPVAWKMSKTGELQNHNSVYSLPNEEASTIRKRRRKGEREILIERPRRRKQSLADRAVQESIRVIRERGHPMSARDLSAVLAQRGIRFGGKIPAHRRLAHLLSMSQDLIGDHSRGNKIRGWSLKEWVQPSSSPPDDQQAEEEEIVAHTWESEAAE